MKRRTFLKLMTATTVMTAFAAPAIVRAQDKRFDGVTLRVNGYGGDYDRLMKKLIAEPLEKRTGLKVSFMPGASATAVTRVIATPDDPPFDIILCDSPSVPQLMTSDVIAATSPGEIKGIEKILPNMREFGDYGLPFSISAMALAYNTKYVKNAITSYADLAHKELKGRVGLFNLENNGGLLTLIALAEANGGSLDNMKPGFDAFAKIFPNTNSLTPSTVNLQQLFQQEEVWAGGFWDGRINAMISSGLPLKIVIPQEGLYAGRSYFCPIKNSKHPEAVAAFLEQALSDEFVGGIASFFRYGPATNVRLPSDIANTILTYGPAAGNIKTVDWHKVAANRSQWFSEFNRTFR
ncbi:extracellular solute-binding protein [uncultured Klebsiella sp.]|uniref:ABC transporter substrate-binding protein n=1 Tax=uncultured Klebsiella sp. TaxID=284011 RepID=UPI0028045B13|nr:extracellular solute-binding protein [uncultured Klebsiella sp.]